MDTTEHPMQSTARVRSASQGEKWKEQSMISIQTAVDQAAEEAQKDDDLDPTRNPIRRDMTTAGYPGRRCARYLNPFEFVARLAIRYVSDDPAVVDGQRERPFIFVGITDARLSLYLDVVYCMMQEVEQEAITIPTEISD